MGTSYARTNVANHLRSTTLARQRSFFRGRHLIKDSDRLITLLIKHMQNLLEAIQLFGGRIKLEVVKTRTHFEPHVAKVIALHVWLFSSKSQG